LLKDTPLIAFMAASAAVGGFASLALNNDVRQAFTVAALSSGAAPIATYYTQRLYNWYHRSTQNNSEPR